MTAFELYLGIASVVFVVLCTALLLLRGLGSFHLPSGTWLGARGSNNPKWRTKYETAKNPAKK